MNKKAYSTIDSSARRSAQMGITMRNEFKGFTKVFRFTLSQHIKNKGYRNITVVVALIALLVPLIGMICANAFDKKEQPYSSDVIQNINVVELTATEENLELAAGVQDDTAVKIEAADYSVLNQMGDSNFSNLTYQSYGSLEDAEADAGKAHTLILTVEYNGSSYDIHVIRPEDSELKSKDANAYESFIQNYFQVILIQKAGLSMNQVQELIVPVNGEVVSAAAAEEEADPLESIKEVFAVVLPYLTIMLLYFMILFYGQGVATSAIMEKTTKLLDTFLVSVKPTAMLLGKVLAIALSGVIQLGIWIVCLIAGFAGGTAVVKTVNPDTDMLLIQLFDSFGTVSGMFTIQGFIMAILIILAGLLMYCGLAAVGGAMAGKTEDLSTTNMIFTMVLVISFLCTLMGGAMSGSIDGSSWQVYVPFTGMLMAPSMVLLGKMTILQSLISLALILITTVVIIWCAGKIYKTLILYKGNPPTPKNILKLLKANQEKK